MSISRKIHKKINLYRKYINFLRLRKSCKTLSSRIHNTPLEIFIESSRDCNIKCTMCARTFDSRFKATSGWNMSMAIFDKVLPMLPKAVKVYAFGNGEPLLNKNFMEMIKIIKSFDAIVHFNTNGVLLNEKNNELLVKVGLDSIVFSFDAATKETYEKIRRGANYKKVLNNVKNLIDIKKRFHKFNPYIGFAVVGMKQNINEIPQLLNLAKDLGVESVYIEPLIWQNDPTYEKFFNDQNLSNIEPIEIGKIMETCKNLAKNFGINFTSPLLKADDYEFIQKKEIEIIREKESRDELFCTQPWTTIFIDWDGKVHPCCGTEEILGDLNFQPLIKIFNNEKFISLRKSIIDKKITEYCNNCVKNKRNKNVIPEISNIFRSWLKK